MEPDPDRFSARPLYPRAVQPAGGAHSARDGARARRPTAHLRRTGRTFRSAGESFAVLGRRPGRGGWIVPRAVDRDGGRPAGNIEGGWRIPAAGPAESGVAPGI